MGRIGSSGKSALTEDDKEQLNAITKSLEAFVKSADSMLGASIVLIMRDHLRKGNPDLAAFYLAKTLHEINNLNNWYAREVNIDLDELRQRITDSATHR